MVQAIDQTFTYPQVRQAVKAGADLITEDAELDLSQRDKELVGLVVNAALFALRGNRFADLDQVIMASYEGVDHPETVRGWVS